MVSDPTLPLTFKKLPLVVFYMVSKNIHNYLKKSIIMLLHFPIMYLRKDGFSSFISNTTAQHIECRSRYENSAVVY